jgi:FkbM family methyltransferase
VPQIYCGAENFKSIQVFMKDYIASLEQLSKKYRVFKPLNTLVNFYWQKRHHRSSKLFYSEFIKKGDLCFDVGANLGNRTQLFLELGARVISVEPQPSCLIHLNKLFGKNSNVRIVPKALSEKEGTAILSICEESPILSTMSDKWQHEGRFSQEFNWSTTQEVPTTTLDSLIEEYGSPVFCKIDVEGFEETVLKGLTKPINFVSFEFTYEFLEDAVKCIDRLTSLGPVKFNFSIGEKMKLYLHDWVTPEELLTKLRSLNNQRLWGDIYAKYN